MQNNIEEEWLGEEWLKQEREITYSNSDFMPEPLFDFVEPTSWIKAGEQRAIYWLAKEIKVNADDLGRVLQAQRSGRPLYEIFYRIKQDGSKRKISAPQESLKKIQRNINRYILESSPVVPNVFGFFGGSILDAIKPHLGAKTIFCVDIKDAFPSVNYDDVIGYFKEWYSWYTAKILAELTILADELPQGAPTSPKLFDLIFSGTDKELKILAEKHKGIYTRYADNIFFSSNQTEFPKKFRRAILYVIEKEISVREWHQKDRIIQKGWQWHKLRVRKNDKGAIRILGLNVVDKKIHNTRAFKARMKLTIHHLNWLLDRGLHDSPEFEKALNKLHGQMGFAQTNTLPDSLIDSYIAFETRISI